MYIDFVTSLLDLSRTVIELVKEHADRRRLEEQKFKAFIFYIRHSKYYKIENLSSRDVVIILNTISEYIQTYYDSELSTIFTSSLKDIYLALRYNSEISEIIIESSLEPLIKELKKRKIKVN